MNLLQMDGTAALRLIGSYLAVLLGMACAAFAALGVVGLAYGAVMLILRHAYGIEIPNPADLFR